MASGSALSPEGLVHLKSYKYSSVDKSYISKYILRHYWNGAVKLLPMWLAPNMVTLIGFMFILINIAFIVIFMPDLVGPGPSWLYYSFAFGLWMYSTMDNIDGKQARRTGTSSPLGELFDHGVDSLNCTLGSLCETAAMGLGPTKTGAFTALVPCLPMFFSTWETYHTHTLYLGYFNGPTEGLILACSVMLISAVYGPQVWTTRIADIVGFESVFGKLGIRDVWVPVLLFAFFAAHLPECVYNVVRARRSRNEPVLPVFLEWIPMIVYCGSIAAWLGSPWSNLLKDNHLVLFCLTMSFVFGRMTTKMILHHLTKRSFPFWTVMLLPLIGGAALTNLPRLGYAPISSKTEARYLQGYFVFALVVYFSWAHSVIDKFCQYLDINCLTIKKRKLDQPETKSLEKDVQQGNGEVRYTKKEL